MNQIYGTEIHVVNNMRKEKLKIIYEDKTLIVVYKKQGMLTVSTNKEKEKTLFHQVLIYEKQKNKNNKVFIVHRLDKDTSGLVIFAKTEKAKKYLQDNWHIFKKDYLAVIHDHLIKKKDTLKSYLKETKTLFVYSTKDSKNGKLAITNYEVISENKDYSLLNINIETGRKNQIRVQLNDLNHPIVGDNKYSNIKSNPLHRLCLEAYNLEIIHPITKKILKFSIPFNKDFVNLCK